MSAREKVRTLYSRNGIRIIKTENIHDPRKLLMDSYGW